MQCLCNTHPFWSYVSGDISSIENHFLSFSVVNSILEHGNHLLLNQPLHVSRPTVQEPENYVRKQENEGATNAILVEELKPEVGRDMLELFFENTKRSGGGDITDIQMYPDSGRAIIWFADASGDVHYFI